MIPSPSPSDKNPTQVIIITNNLGDLTLILEIII